MLVSSFDICNVNKFGDICSEGKYHINRPDPVRKLSVDILNSQIILSFLIVHP